MAKGHERLETNITLMVVLTLAWSLGSVTEAVGTATYLSQILSDRVSLQLIPVLVFLTAAAMAFTSPWPTSPAAPVTRTADERRLPRAGVRWGKGLGSAVVVLMGEPTIVTVASTPEPVEAGARFSPAGARWTR